ncbi:MAG: hypothetical protein IJM44_06135 [Ruminococcus sp.]|nr:hypothetical protein [Ruminococcus sp.]
MQNDVFEKLLADGDLDGTSGLEAELDGIISRDDPDLDRAEELVGEILRERGQKPRKIDVSKALAEIRQDGSQEQFGDEVSGLGVITGRRHRHLRILAALASAAAVIGCITALKLLGRSPDRSEAPPDIVAIVTTVTQTVPAQTKSAHAEISVQTTAADLPEGNVSPDVTETEVIAETQPAEQSGGESAPEETPAQTSAPAESPETPETVSTTYTDELLDFVDSHENVWLWTGTLHIDFGSADNPAYDSAAADPYGIAEAFAEGVNGLSFRIKAPTWLPDDITVLRKDDNGKDTVYVAMVPEGTTDGTDLAESRGVSISAEEWYDEKNVTFYLDVRPQYHIIHDISECTVDGRVAYRFTETNADGFELPGIPRERTIVVYSAGSVVVTYSFFNLTDEEIDMILESISQNN